MPRFFRFCARTACRLGRHTGLPRAWCIALAALLVPMLFCLHPILALYTHNIDLYTASAMIRPLAVLILITIVLWLAFSRVFHTMQKGALAVAVFWLLTFSFGPVANLLKPRGGVLAAMGQYWPLLAVWTVLLAITLVLLIRTRRPLDRLLWGARIAIFSLCVYLLIPVIIYRFIRVGEEAEFAALTRGCRLSARRQIEPQHLEAPNIYLIILDAYPRTDELQDFFHYDNTPFLRKLEAQGFTVMTGNASNYGQTALSVASMLNMGYLDDVMTDINPLGHDRYPLQMLVQQNEVCARLRKHGYKIAAFASSYNVTDLTHADYYLSPRSMLSEFEFGLLDMTPVAPLIVRTLSEDEAHNQRMRFILDHMADPIDPAHPVFVFMHLFACHPPFVFGPHGEARSPDRLAQLGKRLNMDWANAYRAALCDQLTFVNKKLAIGVAKIQRNAKRPTIILLQADHGSDMTYLELMHGGKIDPKYRMMNLSAYYFPPQAKPAMSPIRTPVNLFREILTGYLSERYPPLPDKSLYSEWETPYKFVRVYP